MASTIRLFPEIAMALCVIAYAVVYIVGIKRGKVKPILATRIFLLSAILLSALTNYRQSGINGLLTNALNIVDVFATLSIFLFSVFNKNTRKKFTKFEKTCLSVVIIIFLIWIISGQNILAHLSIQAILVVAYLPTVIHLWKSSENTESLGAWSFDFIASVIGIIEPLKNMDLLPLVYVTRSITSTFVVIILVLRIEWNNSRKNN